MSLTAVTCNVCESPGPAVMPVKFTVCEPAFSLIAAGSAITARVGAWLTGLTVTVKVRVTMLLLVPPSFTVTVIVALPKANATGATLKLPVVFGLV